MIGRVVSVKNIKSATVLVTGQKTHPLYKKSFTSSKKYLVHDELEVKLGDLVNIEKIKPVSKRKHWAIVKVVGRSIEEIIREELKEKAQEAIKEVMPEEKEVKEESRVESQESSEEVKTQKVKVKSSTKSSKMAKKGVTSH